MAHELSLSLGTLSKADRWLLTIFASSIFTKSKIDFFKDPFITSVSMLRQSINVENLLKKARVLLPKSTVLFGVIDEDGVLEENEVFIRIKRDNHTTNPV